MPTNTYTPIGSVTLATATSEVTFTVPTGYRDLVLVVNAIAGSSSYTLLRINGDTGSNYSRVRMYGNAGGTTSNSATQAFLDSGYSASGAYEATIYQFLDYSATDKHKSILLRFNCNSDSIALAAAGRWANTSAITSIQLYRETGNFSIGSTFNLYGIVA